MRKYYVVLDPDGRLVNVLEGSYIDESILNSTDNMGNKLECREVSYLKYSVARRHLEDSLFDSSLEWDMQKTYLLSGLPHLILMISVLLIVLNCIVTLVN